MTIWDAGQYENAHLCELIGGGLASVATKKGTSQVWFRKSFDTGATWSTPVLVGTLPSGKAAQIHQKLDGSLIATNGINIVWKSKNGGKTWTSI